MRGDAAAASAVVRNNFGSKAGGRAGKTGGAGTGKSGLAPGQGGYGIHGTSSTSSSGPSSGSGDPSELIGFGRRAMPKGIVRTVVVDVDLDE